MEIWTNQLDKNEGYYDDFSDTNTCQVVDDEIIVKDISNEDGSNDDISTNYVPKEANKCWVNCKNPNLTGFHHCYFHPKRKLHGLCVQSEGLCNEYNENIMFCSITCKEKYVSENWRNVYGIVIWSGVVFVVWSGVINIYM